MYPEHQMSENSNDTVDIQDEFEAEEVCYESDMEEEVLVDDILGVEGGQDDSENEDDLLETQNDRDDSECIFKKHTGSVFCCAIDPKNGNLAVSGGQDDKAYVWETQNGTVIIECEGHSDSVIMASFNFDGTYVATGDMNGVIQVWKVATKELIWSEKVDETAWFRWHHGTNVLVCAMSTGVVFLWRIPSGECKVISGHAVSTPCGVIMPDGRRLAVGYKDGMVKVYEMKTGQLQGSMESQTSEVSCLDTHMDNNIIAAGRTDGTVNIIKTRPFKLVWTFGCPLETEVAREECYIESVCFCKDSSLSLVAAAYTSGAIFILDYSKQTLRHTYVQEAGLSKMVWDWHGPTLFTAGLDGIVRVLNGRSGSLTTKLFGHQEAILGITLSKDGNTLLSCSDDMTCRVYAITSPDR